MLGQLARQNGSAELHDAPLSVGAQLSALKPDLILLSMPHGIALDRDFLFFGNT
jgi:hypothetical protein